MYNKESKFELSIVEETYEIINKCDFFDGKENENLVRTEKTTYSCDDKEYLYYKILDFLVSSKLVTFEISESMYDLSIKKQDYHKLNAVSLGMDVPPIILRFKESDPNVDINICTHSILEVLEDPEIEARDFENYVWRLYKEIKDVSISCHPEIMGFDKRITFEEIDTYQAMNGVHKCGAESVIYYLNSESNWYSLDIFDIEFHKRPTAIKELINKVDVVTYVSGHGGAFCDVDTISSEEFANRTDFLRKAKDTLYEKKCKKNAITNRYSDIVTFLAEDDKVLIIDYRGITKEDIEEGKSKIVDLRIKADYFDGVDEKYIRELKRQEIASKVKLERELVYSNPTEPVCEDMSFSLPKEEEFPKPTEPICEEWLFDVPSEDDFIDPQEPVCEDNSFSLLEDAPAYEDIESTEPIFVESTLVEKSYGKFDREKMDFMFQISTRRKNEYCAEYNIERGICTFVHYNPKRGGTNPKYNPDKDGILLKLKSNKPNDYKQAAEYYKPYIDIYFNVVKDCVKGQVFTIVPSSKAGLRGYGLELLVKDLAYKYGAEYRDDILIRQRTIEKLSIGGNRSKLIHKNSIGVCNANEINNKIVVVFDDVTTTGNSLLACKELLNESNVPCVMCFAIAKTV